MRLRFDAAYKSINYFPDADLPNFTILTGANGSGKTHLLQAIREGKIHVSGQSPVDKKDIRYFDWLTLVPQEQGSADGNELGRARMAVYDGIAKQQRNQAEIIITAAARAGLPAEYLTNARKLAELSEEELARILGSADLAKAASVKLTKATAAATGKIREALGSSLSLADGVASAVGKPLYLLTRDDFIVREEVPSWGQGSAFQQSFATLFAKYRTLWRKNQLAQHLEAKGELRAVALSDEEFARKYGDPPWDFVNRVLSALGLDFQIDRPHPIEETPYTPRLSKKSTGTDIAFGDLSSGEKVLMAIALCVYFSDDKRVATSYPKLILFDEIDAPLHPSMSRTLLHTINSVLVVEHGIMVIMTTHSPSTVALAPPESVYVKIANGGVTHGGKSAALNLLTSGVPTLAVSYSGRRQVFVESSSDAAIYSALYQLLKDVLGSERSLEFVGTGMRGAGGTEIHAGSQIVVKLVGSLKAAGNMSVFGVIDWDGENIGDDRVFVLGEGRRNGLESLLLDPLLVAATVLRQDWSEAERLGVPKSSSYREFLDYGETALQSIIDVVQANVIGGSVINDAAAAYVGGLVLKVDARYLTMDDHELERKVRGAFPKLNKLVSAHAGALLHYIAENVGNDQRRFLPVEFQILMEKLLQADAH